ncbi:hypothetical protein [Pseudomonas monteilii]|uniref:hypothetical protein n=1 Tax=Pseudomonas monteilii TaxID=76759 RepID=UPI0018A890D7|nr:hypothetical protein [Pseudomonas monteilii]MBF8746841.1 hypothetical protein [Pseudomonas monteilii]
MKVEHFRKGQIVPRRLRILLASVKAAQHYTRFGTDVVWSGRCLSPLRQMGPTESLIVAGVGMSAPRKNGTRRKSGFTIDNRFELSGSYDSSSDHRTASISQISE